MIRSISVLKDVNRLDLNHSSYKEIIVRIELDSADLETPDKRRALGAQLGREIVIEVNGINQ
jgi:hypothetical protein